MRRTIRGSTTLLAAAALLIAACGDDSGGESTTTTPSTAASSTEGTVPQTTAPPTTGGTSTTTTEGTTTTETTLPGGPPVAVQGDSNETVEALQFLLNCNGFGDLVLDGAFGPATLEAVLAAQTAMGRAADGAPDDETLAELSRSCAEHRGFGGEESATFVGNAAPEDPEAFSAALLSGSTVTVTVTRGSGLAATLTGADGVEVEPEGTWTWEVDTTQDYRLEIGSSTGPMTFTITVEVIEGVRETGDWILATDGVTYRGTELALGDDAQTVIDHVFDFLGHGVRGAYDEFDTDWYPITEPQDLGLRGIFIEGFAFLFYGPDPNNPDRPETFARHRFVGPSVDADGNPRPDSYATTAEGITVGDTLADLKGVYGADVDPGSNDEEFYYRFTDSGGELCFYFDTSEEPADRSPITEIASECRTG